MPDEMTKVTTELSVDQRRRIGLFSAISEAPDLAAAMTNFTCTFYGYFGASNYTKEVFGLQGRQRKTVDFNDVSPMVFEDAQDFSPFSSEDADRVVTQMILTYYRSKLGEMSWQGNQKKVLGALGRFKYILVKVIRNQRYGVLKSLESELPETLKQSIRYVFEHLTSNCNELHERFEDYLRANQSEELAEVWMTYKDDSLELLTNPTNLFDRLLEYPEYMKDFNDLYTHFNDLDSDLKKLRTMNESSIFELLDTDVEYPFLFSSAKGYRIAIDDIAAMFDSDIQLNLLKEVLYNLD